MNTETGIGLIDYNNNPTLCSPNCHFELPFKQSRETLLDVETYKNFLKSAIGNFRHSKTYKHYKSYLIGLGLDKCQFHSNITADMQEDGVTIEMHHNMLTIFDITLIICEHVINTNGYITSFDLAELLRQEHINNRVQVVMLSATPHQLYHNEPEFAIHPSMCFGDWVEFLKLYNTGITRDIAMKIIYYLDKSIKEGKSNDNDLLSLRQSVLDWSRYNEYHYS